MLWTHYILHSANTSNWSFKVFSIEVFLKYAIMVHQISSHNINFIANKILPLLFASCYVSSPIAAASRDIIALFIDTKRETAKIFKKYSYTVTVPVLFVIICRSWSNQFRDIYDYLFDVETAFLFYDAWFQQWVSVGIGFTFWFIIGIFGFFKPEIKTDFLKCQKYINGLLIRFVTLYVWYWFINHWISSYFIALLYIYSFCFYKIPVIFLSDLGGIFSEFGTSLGKNLQENKDKLKQDSDDHLFQNKDEIVVYGYFKQYIEHEIDYVFPTEILLEILRFYNIKYSIEWDINNSIDYGKKLLILNEGNTARWSGELADTQQMEANKKGVIAVSNHSIGYLGEDSNLNLKMVDLRFKIRSIINPGYPLVSITFIDEKDLKTVRESPDKMDQVSEMYSYNSMVNRMNVFDDGSIKSFWDIKKLKKKIMKQLNEDDVICLRFDFEKEVAQYYKNDIAQGTEIKISKDTKYKICACLCFQGDDITFV